LQVLVRDNNIDQALRVLKKKMQREGLFREMKQRRSYEKPSERKNREKSEAIRRARKLARKKAVREGLIADPKKKLMDEKKKAMGQRPGGGMGMGDRGGRF
jgi:small subunit ribosomal protein S21